MKCDKCGEDKELTDKITADLLIRLIVAFVLFWVLTAIIFYNLGAQ